MVTAAALVAVGDALFVWSTHQQLSKPPRLINHTQPATTNSAKQTKISRQTISLPTRSSRGMAEISLERPESNAAGN